MTPVPIPFHNSPIPIPTQACLKGFYVSWLSDKHPLESLIVELLTRTHLPPINCLPVKKPFGALRELVLYPIHEESTLPYTSTAAIKLLRSIGECVRTHVQYCH